MCCRYLLEESPELRPIVEAMNRSPLAGKLFPAGSLRAAGEVRPADAAPVLARSRQGQPLVFPMKWGFSIPGIRSTLINARSETASIKPTFSESWRRRRCAIPASWYYEWEHVKTTDGKTVTGEKYALQPAGAAGFYRLGKKPGIYFLADRSEQPRRSACDTDTAADRTAYDDGAAYRAADDRTSDRTFDGTADRTAFK